MRSHRHIIKNIVIVFCLVILVGLIVGMVAAKSPSKVVIKVNNEEVFQEEFERVMMEERNKVYDYFMKEYDVKDNNEFWVTSYDGEIPLEMIKKLSIDKLVNIKVQQQLAKQNNILENTDYRIFLEDLSKENSRRQEALKQREVIFGPTQFSEKAYFDKVFGEMVRALKMTLFKDEIRDSKNLMTFYNNYKDMYFQKNNTYTIEGFSIPILSTIEVDLDIHDMPEYLEISRVKERINKGENFEVIANSFIDTKDVKLEYFHETLNESSYKKDIMTMPTVMGTLKELQCNEISSIIHERDKFYIVKCLGKEQGGYFQFDEVKENIKNMYMEIEYKKIVEKNIEQAEITINKNVYNALKIR